MLRRALSTKANLFDAGHLQKELIKSYLRKSSNLFLCHNNEKLSEKVCQVIGAELKNENKVVFEAAPGSGILTEQLLKHGVPRVRVFEHIEAKQEALKSLQHKYGNRLEIVDKQILDYVNGHYKLLNLSRDDLAKACFEGIPVQKNWSKGQSEQDQEPVDSSIQLLTVLSPFIAREFLSFLVYALARYDSFFSTGPTQFYLFVPVSQYRQMLSKPSRNLQHYTAFAIQINSLFDYHEIDLYCSNLKGVERAKIDTQTHTLVPSDYFAYTNGRPFKTKEDFVFISIKPKQMVNRLDAEFMINYATFVKQSFSKRTNCAVKYYEKHFPGCAIDLIGLGISYFKTFGDLTSDEMFQIFSHFYQTPQYENSIFKELS